MRRSDRKRHRPGRARPAVMVESRAAEAVTVFWMLTILAVTLAGLGALSSGVLHWMWVVPSSSDAAAPSSQPLLLLSGSLLFTASVCGAVCLLLTPLAYRIREHPPPLSITVFAVLVSVVPMITLAVILVRG